MLGTSSLHEVRANYGERAYYLAESGFRYAASVLRHDGAEEFWAMDGEKFDVPGGGSFFLELNELTDDEDYDSEYEVAGEQAVEPHGSLELAGGANLAPRNGLFSYQGGWYRYREFVDDTLVEVIAAPPNRREAQGEQTIDKGESLQLKSGSEIPPEGHFYYQDTKYTYENLSGGALLGISGDADDFPLTVEDGEQLRFPAAFPLKVAVGESIRFASILEVRSTGEYPGDTSNLNVKRTVTYWFYSADAFPPMVDDDGFYGDGEMIASDMDSFGEGPGAKGKGAPLGKFGAVEVDGAPAIQLQGMNPGGQHPMTSLIYDGQVGPEYEVQVKIKIEQDLEPMAYMAGITFRLQGGGNTPGQLGQGFYGVSFVKGHPDASGNNAPPAGIVDNIGEGPHIVLWKPDSGGANFGAKLLASHSLVGSSIVDEDGRLKDWSTLLVRVRQLGEPGEEYNSILVMYGDHALASVIGDDNAYNDDVRLSSTRGGVQSNGAQVLPWPPNEIGQWKEDVDYFTVTTIDKTDDDENLGYESESVAEVGLHTWGHNLVVCTGQGANEVCDGLVYFDNFGIREAGQAPVSGGVFGGGYIPPIQQ